MKASNEAIVKTHNVLIAFWDCQNSVIEHLINKSVYHKMQVRYFKKSS